MKFSHVRSMKHGEEYLSWIKERRKHDSDYQFLFGGEGSEYFESRLSSILNNSARSQPRGHARMTCSVYDRLVVHRPGHKAEYLSTQKTVQDYLFGRRPSNEPGCKYAWSESESSDSDHERLEQEEEPHGEGVSPMSERGIAT